MGLLQAGYQRVLMVDFDGFLPEFYHSQLPTAMPTWPYATAWVIESGGEWQCRPSAMMPFLKAPTAKPAVLRHYLQNSRTFTLPGERVQWRWSRA